MTCAEYVSWCLVAFREILSYDNIGSQRYKLRSCDDVSSSVLWMLEVRGGLVVVSGIRMGKSEIFS